MKINFSSSGQQESVWILNLLFYYLAQNEPVLFIIEEPESHLFPESQKYITELISLVNNSGHSMLCEFLSLDIILASFLPQSEV